MPRNKKNMSSCLTPSDLKNLHVTVMGLGLNGGGLAATKFLCAHGARVTVTDLRDESTLAPSLAEIANLPVRLVLGKHDDNDFSSADMVIKNPAVRPGNKYVAMSKKIETDLSLFFQFNSNPVIGITGSKGKSTTSSALHDGLLENWPGARLGGNITVSPLSFLHELNPGDPVVLELSSFQLGDLALSYSYRQSGKLSSFPLRLAIMTSLFPDHQDYYGSMPAYLTDKQFLFAGQGPQHDAILRTDDVYASSIEPGHARRWYVETRPSQGLIDGKQGAYLNARGEGILSAERESMILPEKLAILGEHHRGNLLQAALALSILGVDHATIARRLSAFKGIEHRLEPCGELPGINFVNDSAATIPQAALEAVKSIKGRVHLITGGTDKALEFETYLAIAKQAGSLHLLSGTASDKIIPLLQEAGCAYHGPFNSIEAALSSAVAQAHPSDTVLLSPGCASFGLFLNEFDRGRKFKAAVQAIVDTKR